MKTVLMVLAEQISFQHLQKSTLFAAGFDICNSWLTMVRLTDLGGRKLEKTLAELSREHLGTLQCALITEL